MGVLRKLVRNIATNWVGLAVNTAVSFFLAPFVVNSLGATYYGIWAVTLQFTGYLYLMDFGVRDAVIRYVAKFYATGAARRLNEIVRIAIQAYFPIFVAAVLLAAVGSWAFPHYVSVEAVSPTEMSLVFFLTCMTIAQGFLFNVFTGVLNGIQRFDIGNYLGMTFGLLRAGLTVLALSNGYGIVGLAIIQLGISLAMSLCYVIAARHILLKDGITLRWVPISPKRRRVLIRRILGYSSFVFINNIGQKTNAAAGALIIAFFLPVATVTPYAIAASLTGYVRALVLASSWVFNPLFAHFATLKDTAALSGAIRRGTKLAVLVSLPLLTAFLTVGDIFIGLWMGPAFVVDAARVLSILAIMEILSAPHHIMAAALYGVSKHKELAVLRVIEAVVNVGLSVLLVQRYGIIGAAVGALVPHCILTCVCLPILIRKHLKVPLRLFKDAYLRPLIAVAPFAFLTQVLFMEWSPENLLEFFLAMAAVSSVYVASVYFFALDAVERSAITEASKKFQMQMGRRLDELS